MSGSYKKKRVHYRQKSVFCCCFCCLFPSHSFTNYHFLLKNCDSAEKNTLFYFFTLLPKECISRSVFRGFQKKKTEPKSEHSVCNNVILGYRCNIDRKDVRGERAHHYTAGPMYQAFEWIVNKTYIRDFCFVLMGSRPMST